MLWSIVPLRTKNMVMLSTTCVFSRKLLGRDIGGAADVPAIAMATVWLIKASPSASSPEPPAAPPCGQPGRPH